MNRISGRLAFLGLALLAAVSIGGVASSAAPKTRSAARTAGAKALPDSVLAVVGGDRVITVTGFRSAWHELQPPARPDSLTPAGAAEFLELLIGKECLGRRALAETWTWTRSESLRYEGLRDRLTLTVTFDSAMADVRRRLGTAAASLTPEGVGTAGRDTFFAIQSLTWDEALLERVRKAFDALPKPSPDSGIMAQMRILGASPVVTAEDRAKALIQGTVGEFTVAELLEAWGRLNPLARPRIETADQVRDLARNGVFERRLRRDARARRVEEWPHVQRALAREREYIAVEHFVGREVYGKIANDSTSLRRYFHENVEFWRLPLRASVIRLDLPDRASANRMAVMLSNPAEADTLVARGLRQGARYKIEIAEELDSLLFARVVRARPDAVLGPDSTAQGWRVVKVGEILPSRLRRFEEVERLVRQRFYGVEGERLIVELLERLRRETPVTIHREALAKLRLD